MKNDKGTLFFVTIMCIILCGASFISMVYSFRLAKVADEENIIYKDIVTHVEFSDGANIEIIGNKKNNYVDKTLVIKNMGEDPIYADVIWKSIDLFDPNSENPFSYTIKGTSVNGLSTLSSSEGIVPLDTSVTLLSGETIEPGDEAVYEIRIKYNLKKANAELFLYASLGANIRH